MNRTIIDSLRNGNLILFLGAGASFTSKTQSGNSMPMGEQLSKLLCEKANIPYNGENLNVVYGAVKPRIGEINLQKFLETQFKFCKYSKEYEKITRMPLKRIYTLNIDDCLDRAFNHARKNIEIKNRNDHISEYSFENEITTIIKLNGDINKPDVEYIFSPEQYAKNINSNSNWYSQLVNDMFTYTFVFIGTKLNEPLLEYHLQKFKTSNNINIPNKGFVITPSATEIEKLSLENTNLEHINGTLLDFISYTDSYFNGKIPEFQDVLRTIKPYIINTDISLSMTSKITPVTTKNIIDAYINNEKKEVKKIRNYYKGFKPTWNDIVNNIPIILSKTNKFILEVLSDISNSNNLYVITGMAGSGKSTALKQVALAILKRTAVPVYFIDNSYDSLNNIVKYLDSINNEGYVICIDRIINNRYSSLSEIIHENNSKASFIITENSTLWNKKGKLFLEQHTKYISDISDIELNDIDPILEKLRLFGSWTVLEKMTVSQRKNELWHKARKQLLIGLLEATSGIGYNQIIQNDFNSIDTIDEKNLLILASIPALENLYANEETLQRAILDLNHTFKDSIKNLSINMTGILNYQDGKIYTRHRIYSRKLFENIDNENLYEIVSSYVNSFCVYKFPIVKNVSNMEAEVYKKLLNFNFLNDLFNENEDFVLKLYKDFEKELEHDGFFLLQYGLALRSHHKQFESYEKLQLALSAYPNSPQIAHSLAQQKLILASSQENIHNLNRDQLFSEAKVILTKLIDVAVGDFKKDRYPIVTLAKGHIDYLLFTKDLPAAKDVAKEYFNKFQKFPEYKNKTDTHLYRLATELMRFSITGEWNIKD